MELSKLRRKLVKLFHPDRFAHEPEKQETYHRLTAAINHAADTGDFATLREIADDPHGFILRQGWAALDFSEERELAQLRRLMQSVALTMAERGQRHVERMADVAEKVAPHVETMKPGEIFERIERWSVSTNSRGALSASRTEADAVGSTSLSTHTAQCGQRAGDRNERA